MKYITFIAPGGRPLPVLFPDDFAHDVIAEALRPQGMVACSAGFVQLGEGFDPKTVGESETLNLKPNPYDAEIIRCAHLNSRANDLLLFDYTKAIKKTP